MHHDKIPSWLLVFHAWVANHIRKSRWGLNMLFYGEFGYIYLHYEWTEHVLSCFEQRFWSCSLYQVVYASLYSYSCNVHILRAFYESWCPTINTLHTVSVKMSISLWDLHRLCGLPINGRIYDQIIPSIQIFNYWDKQEQKVIPCSCKFLFTTFRSLEKVHHYSKWVSAKVWIDFWCNKKFIHNLTMRSRYHNLTPTKTHNLSC